MTKKNLDFKHDFLFLKGEVIGYDDKKKKIEAEFDLSETFKDPEDKSLELSFDLEDGAEIKKLKLEVENGEVVEKDSSIPGKREDIERGDYILVSFFSEDDLISFLENKDDRSANNLLIYK